MLFEQEITFQQKVVALAIVVFVIMVIFMLVSANNANYGHSWPPKKGIPDCPDYWTGNSTACVPNVDGINNTKEKYTRNTNVSTGEKTKMISNFPIAVDENGTLDVSRASYCDRHNFAKLYGIDWNGVSYGTAQDVDITCENQAQNPKTAKIDLGYSGFTGWVSFVVIAIYCLYYYFIYGIVRQKLTPVKKVGEFFKTLNTNEAFLRTWKVYNVTAFVESLAFLIICVIICCLIVVGTLIVILALACCYLVSAALVIALVCICIPFGILGLIGYMLYTNRTDIGNGFNRGNNLLWTQLKYVAGVSSNIFVSFVRIILFIALFLICIQFAGLQLICFFILSFFTLVVMGIIQGTCLMRNLGFYLSNRQQVVDCTKLLYENEFVRSLLGWVNSVFFFNLLFKILHFLGIVEESASLDIDIFTPILKVIGLFVMYIFVIIEVSVLAAKLAK
jgi:hypothetical protein